LHDAGIEVILDVVYNHTAEGNERGPTLSWRGIDNASYYKLSPENPRHAWDSTGTGNTLDLSHPRVLQMVLDSLRYWVETFHVDGFRFDLARPWRATPSSSRPTRVPARRLAGPGARPHEADRRALGRRQRRLSGRRLSPGWSEWNDQFRDNIRAFWRSDPGQLPGVARVMTGLGEVFAPSGGRCGLRSIS
jgi:glycogen operon protein